MKIFFALFAICLLSLASSLPARVKGSFGNQQLMNSIFQNKKNNTQTDKKPQLRFINAAMGQKQSRFEIYIFKLNKISFFFVF